MTPDVAAGDAPVSDVGEQHSVETARKRLRRLQRERDNALGALLEQRQGRALVWHWLSRCGVFHGSFNRDAGVMAFSEGRRDVGLSQLADVMRVSPAAYPLMQTEAAQDAASRT